MPDDLEEFLEMLLAERGAALNTIDAYRRDLEDYRANLKRNGRTPRTASPDDIREWIGGMSDSGMAASTVARRISALRQFYGFLFAEGRRGDDPTTLIDSPRRGRTLPKVLDEAEVALLLAGTEETPGIAGVRLKAMLELLYATGMRVSELVGLPLSAVTRNPDFILVSGKGGKQRLTPVNNTARDALASYVAVREAFIKGKKSSKWLFPSGGKGGHLTRQRCGQMLKELAIL